MVGFRRGLGASAIWQSDESFHARIGRICSTRSIEASRGKASNEISAGAVEWFQARAVGRGFTRAVKESGYAVYACSILDDHVHLVIAPSARSFEQIVRHLRGRATTQLRTEGVHPLASYQKPDGSIPSIWSEGIWKVFCFDEDHVGCAIRYVEKNPIREGKPAQT